MLTAALALLLDPLLLAAAARDTAAPAEPETIVVLPLEVDGELPDKWRGEAESRLRAGLDRSGVTLVAADPGGPVGCRDRACIRGLADTATHVVRPRLQVAPGERDYSFAIDVSSTRTGEVVATVEGECDLCGFEEVGALIEAKAAAAASSIERLRAAVAMVELESTPPGATLEVDGTRIGTTPTALELAPGTHRVRVTKPGFRAQTIEVEAIEGLRKTIELPLVAEVADTSERDHRRQRALFVSGGVLIGLGVGGLGAGAALLAIDGRPHRSDCQADVEGNCRFVYGTRNGGIAAV
ncbi:MAG TPA: PEGA domain-containing protein, partial [Nannocystaceae bacterium]|nr:PEGA domain-containing protein [Nannocystaceae bacterium]